MQRSLHEGNPYIEQNNSEPEGLTCRMSALRPALPFLLVKQIHLLPRTLLGKHPGQRSCRPTFGQKDPLRLFWWPFRVVFGAGACGIWIQPQLVGSTRGPKPPGAQAGLEEARQSLCPAWR